MKNKNGMIVLSESSCIQRDTIINDPSLDTVFVYIIIYLYFFFHDAPFSVQYNATNTLYLGIRPHSFIV